MAVHPNGSQVFTASADKTAKVFDVNTGTVVRSLAGHGDAVRAVAFTKDAAKVVTGSADKTIRTWNAANGKPLLTYPGAAGRRPGAGHLRRQQVAGRRPGRQHGQGLRPDPGRPGQGRAPADLAAMPARSSPWRSCPTTRRSSPPPRTRRSRSGPDRPRPLEEPRRPPGPGLHRRLVARRQAGRHRRRRQALPPAGTSRRGRRSAPSRRRTRTSSTPWPTAPRATSSPPAATTSSSSSGTPPTARSCARAPATARRSTAWPSAPTAPSSPRGSVDKTIRIWNVADGKEVNKLDGHPDDVYSVAFSPDGKRLASIGYGGNLFVWDVDAAKAIFQQKVAPNTLAYGVAWSPDGKQLAVAASDNKGCFFFGGGGKRETSSPPAATTSWSSSGNPSQRQGAEQGRPATARRCTASSLQSRREQARLVARSTRPSCIWNVADGKELAKLDGHPDDVYSGGLQPRRGAGSPRSATAATSSSGTWPPPRRSRTRRSPPTP